MFDSSVSSAVAQRVPEVEDPVRPTGEEARAEHHVGDAPLERLEHHGVLGGVVLEVGVLHDDVLGRCTMRERRAQRRALAPVDGVAQHADPRVVECSGEHLRRCRRSEPSSTTTISAIHGDVQHPVDQRRHRAGLVEARHGHRQAGRTAPSAGHGASIASDGRA